LPAILLPGKQGRTNKKNRSITKANNCNSLPSHGRGCQGFWRRGVAAESGIFKGLSARICPNFCSPWADVSFLISLRHQLFHTLITLPAKRKALSKFLVGSLNLRLLADFPTELVYQVIEFRPELV
jgi:hypothetical protein